MITRNIFRLSQQLNFSVAKCATSSLIRYQSTTSKSLLLTDVNDKTGIATMTMNNLPVNSLSLELLTDMSRSFDELNKNKCRGMILSSGAETVFSAGIDINEMYKPDPKRMRDFWRTLQDVWIKLYGSSFPTAAAIHGHAPAGGCFLSMSCEYRVMCPKYTIGLNETQLGIVAPWWFMVSMKNTISPRQAEMALTLGTLFKTDEALRIGMIDEVAANKTEAIAKCEKFLLKFQKIPSEARAATKLGLRGADIDKLIKTRDADIELFAVGVSNEKVQKSLGFYIRILKARKIVKTLTKPFGSLMRLFGVKSKSKKSE